MWGGITVDPAKSHSVGEGDISISSIFKPVSLTGTCKTINTTPQMLGWEGYEARKLLHVTHTWCEPGVGSGGEKRIWIGCTEAWK